MARPSRDTGGGGRGTFTCVLPLFLGVLGGWWWPLCLLGVGLLFTLLLVCCLMCRCCGAPGRGALSAGSVGFWRRRGFWGACSERVFVAITLSCAGVYLVSRFPGPPVPFWLGPVLQAFTYASAFLLYGTWVA